MQLKRNRTPALSATEEPLARQPLRLRVRASQAVALLSFVLLAACDRSPDFPDMPLNPGLKVVASTEPVTRHSSYMSDFGTCFWSGVCPYYSWRWCIHAVPDTPHASANLFYILFSEERASVSRYNRSTLSKTRRLSEHILEKGVTEDCDSECLERRAERLAIAEKAHQLYRTDRDAFFDLVTEHTKEGLQIAYLVFIRNYGKSDEATRRHFHHLTKTTCDSTEWKTTNSSSFWQ